MPLSLSLHVEVAAVQREFAGCFPVHKPDMHFLKAVRSLFTLPKRCFDSKNSIFLRNK